ncbi:S41 family peptidase [uncultured Flavobacterium sp.]|uniref:S41 family peptidase n=1 Tax=uncultured Flavobacterium sp. TaxID=165435 RepID=UPI0025CD68A8|nr:S41 family peptidase [uncultured Flavobacterium sp.]
MKKYLISLKAFLFLFIVSCQNDDGPPVYLQGSNEYTNQWIYQQMKRYYYWNGAMPGQGDLSIEPKEYFSSLLQQGDTFSYALHPSLADTYPKSVRTSFGFDMAFVEYQGQVYGTVLYVLSDSPAHYSILERGMYITAINGTPLNRGNYEGLYRDLSASGQAQLQVAEYNGQGFSAPVQVIIAKGVTLLQPLLKRIIIQGNDKIGYIAIPHFDIGLSQSLLEAFLEFKSQSVNKVVVDLRYNGGGDVSSATALSIILAPDIQADDHFITFEGNSNGGIIKQSFEEALEMNENQVGFEALRAAHPTVGKVYILCGGRTASASELVINNLKPFMDVVTIGEPTLGKDVAGFPIEDDRVQGEQGWILYPSIYKLFNAHHQGDYDQGIQPFIALNELQQPEIFPLGDPQEILLAQVLNTIVSNGRMSGPSALRLLPQVKSDFGLGPILPGQP